MREIYEIVSHDDDGNNEREYRIKRDIIKLLAQRPLFIHCKTSVSDSSIFHVENQ
jgi:hypothetical protein